MDFKVLARFIVFLGIVLLAFGGFRLATNQPEKFDSSKSEMTVLGRNDMGNMFSVHTRNSERKGNGRLATVVMVGSLF
jgi:hypothetical protein